MTAAKATLANTKTITLISVRKMPALFIGCLLRYRHLFFRRRAGSARVPSRGVTASHVMNASYTWLRGVYELHSTKVRSNFREFLY
jgi:hypothetical protein